MIPARQRIRWMMSLAMVYAGAALAPKNTVTGVLGGLPARMSR
jgi:hypothetical protein